MTDHLPDRLIGKMYCECRAFLRLVDGDWTVGDSGAHLTIRRTCVMCDTKLEEPTDIAYDQVPDGTQYTYTFADGMVISRTQIDRIEIVSTG